MATFIPAGLNGHSTYLDCVLGEIQSEDPRALFGDVPERVEVGDSVARQV